MLPRGLDTQLRSLSLNQGSSSSSPARSSKSRGSVPDRFIPRRSTGTDAFSLFEQRRVTEASPDLVETTPAKQEYRQALCDIILPPVSPSPKILPLTLSPTSPGPHIPDGRFFSLASPRSLDCGTSDVKARKRNIPKSPDKILDAPDIVRSSTPPPPPQTLTPKHLASFFTRRVQANPKPGTPNQECCQSDVGPIDLHCTAGSSRFFNAIRKDAGLYCGSRLRSGEVFAYVGLSDNLKDLKDLHPDFSPPTPG